jgi:hypothetical protein
MILQDFIRKLNEFGPKVTISPLSETEVKEIELILNRVLPHYYREFLLRIGLKQDVVWGLNDSINDFDPLQDFLPNGQAKNFFRFGHNGGEDYWLLRSDDPSDRTIYEYEYYGDGEIKSLGKTFDELLDEAILLLTENKDKLVDNSQKVWAVQFSIDTDGVTQIIESLGKEFECNLSREICKTEVSSAGVICSEGSILLQGQEIPIKKQEYKSWETASYYFNWREPVEVMNTNSLIKRIENRLKSDGLKVTLIDYGVTDAV